jgi:hypothetical protein
MVISFVLLLRVQQGACETRRRLLLLLATRDTWISGGCLAVVPWFVVDEYRYDINNTKRGL